MRAFKRVAALLCASIALALMPALALADENVVVGGESYHGGDVAIIQGIINTSGALQQKLGSDATPADVVKLVNANNEYNQLDNNPFVEWTECAEPGGTVLRASKLNLRKAGVSGTIDASGLNELAYLDCGYNEDVSGVKVSENAKLAYLNCSVTGLASLDVSKNAALEKLFCSYTDIAEIDVSGCPDLETLECRCTDVSSLDLSKNAELINLSCDETNIASLDVSNSPHLEVLYCLKTGITKLALPSEGSELRILSCSSTGLSGSLDVSKLVHLEHLRCYETSITSLSGLKNLSELQTLDCRDTPIASLDPAGLASLEVLLCSGTPIKALDLAGCAALRDLDIRGTGIEGTFDVSGLKEIKWVAFSTPVTLALPGGASLALREATGGFVEASVDLRSGITGNVTVWPVADEGYEFEHWVDLPESASVGASEASFNLGLGGQVSISAQFGALSLTGIEVTEQPSKLSYVAGEDFDPSGMVVSATYEDGSTREIGGYLVEPAGALSASDTSVMISYTENGTTKSTEVGISVSAPYIPPYVPPAGPDTATIPSTYEDCGGGDKCPLAQFADANPSAWYHDGLHWAVESGVLKGGDDGKMMPNQGITREMLMVMLHRYAASAGMNTAAPAPRPRPCSCASTPPRRASAATATNDLSLCHATQRGSCLPPSPRAALGAGSSGPSARRGRSRCPRTP